MKPAALLLAVAVTALAAGAVAGSPAPFFDPRALGTHSMPEPAEASLTRRAAVSEGRAAFFAESFWRPCDSADPWQR